MFLFVCVVALCVWLLPVHVSVSTLRCQWHNATEKIMDSMKVLQEQNKRLQKALLESGVTHKSVRHLLKR